MLLTTFLIIPSANGQVEIILESSADSVSPGENFTIDIYVIPDVPIAGIQMDVKFDPLFASAVMVEEGDLLQTSCSPTYFNSSNIDNKDGMISNIYGFILRKGTTSSNTSSSGYFAHVSFTADNAGGTYEFDAKNIVVSNESGASLPVISQSAFVSQPSQSASGSTSRSEGGGGGGSDGEPPSNVILKQVVSKNIVSQNPVSYGFDDPLNPVVYINFTPLTNVGQTKATVEVLNNTSVFVDSSAGDSVYGNFNIWIGLAGYATPSNIENAEIVFRIPVKWIQQTETDVSHIVLKRYNNDTWETLPTEVISANGADIYFKSRTPGFSPFSIIYGSGVQDSEDNSSINVSDGDNMGDEVEDTVLPEVSQNWAFLLMLALFLVVIYRH